MSQQLKRSMGEQLLSARQENLKNIQEGSSVKAHGKVSGMDTFSWVDPEMDSLARMIGSMPNASVWVVEFKQLEWFVRYYPECIDKIHSVVIYDCVEEGSVRWLDKLSNVAFTPGVTDAMMFLKAIEKKKMSFFFTTSGVKARSNQEEFEVYLKQFY